MRSTPISALVDVEKLKLDGAVWRWQAREVATDVHGTWLYSPAGTVCQGRDGAEYIQPANGVQLMPDHQCWAAWWGPRAGGRRAARASPVTR